MIIRQKMNDADLLKYIYNAAKEYSKLVEKSFLIIGKNNNTDYSWFECNFEKRYFMHLLGIKSKNYSANDFYDECNKYNNNLGHGITIKDCTPSRNHNRTTINEKSSVCADILKIREAKYFKIGEKDKILQYVDFSYAYGNEVILGFKKDNGDASFPITLITKNIDNFCSKKYKVLFIFTKDIFSTYYENLYMEIKSGIIHEHYQNFPDKLKDKIMIHSIKNRIFS